MRRWCWHKWSRWVDGEASMAIGGAAVVQMRRCGKCRKLRIRQVIVK